MAPNFNSHLMTLAKRNTRSNIIKNYDFDYPQCRAKFTVTCVAGHILHYDFIASHRPWTSCDPFDLFEAHIEGIVTPDRKAIVDNLQSEARNAQQLMIWTDCDREGENIGSEIKRICLKANRNIIVKRARFSAIIAQYAHLSLSRPSNVLMVQIGRYTMQHSIRLSWMNPKQRRLTLEKYWTFVLAQHSPDCRLARCSLSSSRSLGLFLMVSGI
jgi:DNA topoisomerase IA